MKLFAIVAALCVGASWAACPNDCSGNGLCNQYSACQCYRNFMGADCSERVCYFGVAFVDTPQGDLNADGFVSDQTFPSRAANEPTHELYSQYLGWGTVNYKWDGTAEVGGTSGVILPVSVVGDAGGEAHFYKECAAKGKCNRQTGLCECFEGYEGSGCTRTTCPNSCSGHGTCRTIEELKYMDPTAATATFKYSAWDNEVSQSCVCEPGYFGVDCSLRMCPSGDDPVTKYEGYTKITFNETSSDLQTGLHDATDYTAQYINEWHFTEVVWDYAAYASGNKYWSPWYATGTSTTAGGYKMGTYAQTAHANGKYVTHNEGVVYTSNAIAYNRDLVVTGSMTGARGVQRRRPLYTTDAASPVKVMAPGCCTLNAAKSAVDCTKCDFFSLYLSEVTGEFALGDRIQISWDAPSGGSGAGNGFAVANYISSISTFYSEAEERVQRNEEQVLNIKFGVPTAAGAFKGYFSLTFTDELGDSYTTEAIKVSVAEACNPDTVALGFPSHVPTGVNKPTCPSTTPTSTSSMSGLAYQADQHGDFVYHADTATVSRPYKANKADAMFQDKAGGAALAARIEAALEALPNGVTGDVEVGYAYNHAADTGDANTARTAAQTRRFVVRFMEAAGDLPLMTVNYAIQEGAAVKSNQVCGARGSVQRVMLTKNAATTTNCGAATVITTTGLTCEVYPVFSLTTGTSGSDTTHTVVTGVAIREPGSGCTAPAGQFQLDFSGSCAAQAEGYLTGSDLGGTLDCLAIAGLNYDKVATENSDTDEQLFVGTGIANDQNIWVTQTATEAFYVLDPYAYLTGGNDITRLWQRGGTLHTLSPTTGYTATTGTSYTTAPTLVVSRPHSSTGVQASVDVAISSTNIATAQITVAKAGTGYFANAVITVQGGVNTGTDLAIANSGRWTIPASLTGYLGVRGTTENAECSNRGTCDYSSGTCRCFASFTGKDCSVQNALSTGGGGGASISL